MDKNGREKVHKEFTLIRIPDFPIDFWMPIYRYSSSTLYVVIETIEFLKILRDIQIKEAYLDLSFTYPPMDIKLDIVGDIERQIEDYLESHQLKNFSDMNIRELADLFKSAIEGLGKVIRKLTTKRSTQNDKDLSDKIAEYINYIFAKVRRLERIIANIEKLDEIITMTRVAKISLGERAFSVIGTKLFGREQRNIYLGKIKKRDGKVLVYYPKRKEFRVCKAEKFISEGFPVCDIYHLRKENIIGEFTHLVVITSEIGLRRRTKLLESIDAIRSNL